MMDWKAFTQVCLSNDFGKPFVIDGYIPEVTEKAWKQLQQGTEEVLPWHDKSVRVTVYTGGFYPRVVRFLLDVPTFDSSDRRYDSWHDLYLICKADGGVSGVYVTGGYEVSGICGFEKLLDCPEAMKALLK